MFVEPYSLKNKVERVLFQAVWTLFVRPFPRRILRKWNIAVLRMFGAQVSWSAVVYSKTKIQFPKNLIMDDESCLAENTILENAAPVHLMRGSIVSQYSYLCTASHDIRNADFPQFSKPITIEKGSWVAASCFIGPGVTVGDGAVVGARSAVFKDVEPNTVVGGNPAKFIKYRNLGGADLPLK